MYYETSSSNKCLVLKDNFVKVKDYNFCIINEC